MNHQHLPQNLECTVIGVRSFAWTYNGKSGTTRYLVIMYNDPDTVGARAAEIKIPSICTIDATDFISKKCVVNTYVNDVNGKKDLCLYNITAK